MKTKIRRLIYDQSARKHVYCYDGFVHLTITDPAHPYSGDPHTLEFADCDCAAIATPSTPQGEDENDGTQNYKGSDPAENPNGISAEAPHSAGRESEGNSEQGECDGQGESAGGVHEDGRDGWDGEVGSKTSH